MEENVDTRICDEKKFITNRITTHDYRPYLHRCHAMQRDNVCVCVCKEHKLLVRRIHQYEAVPHMILHTDPGADLDLDPGPYIWVKMYYNPLLDAMYLTC